MHLQPIWLRVAIFGVCLFIFLFSLLFSQQQDILMFFALTGTIYLGWAGSAIIGGLYWKRGTTAIFDVRVTDTEAPAYRGQDPERILRRHEDEKKDKYLAACLSRRRHFTPLVFSVDGMRSPETVAASKRVARLLSGKWQRTYSAVCGYVRSRLSVALVRTASQCLRGARDPMARASRPQWDGGAGLRLYR